MFDGLYKRIEVSPEIKISCSLFIRTDFQLLSQVNTQGTITGSENRVANLSVLVTFDHKGTKKQFCISGKN